MVYYKRRKTKILTRVELKKIFNKFNLVELDEFNNIFEYVKDIDLEDIVKTKDEVYKEKLVECISDYEVPVKSTFSKELSLEKNLKDLNYKEIEFLYELFSDASFYLSSIRENSDSYKNVINDFDEGDYPIDLMYELESSLYNELEERKRNKPTRIVLKINQ